MRAAINPSRWVCGIIRLTLLDIALEGEAVYPWDADLLVLPGVRGIWGPQASTGTHPEVQRTGCWPGPLLRMPVPFLGCQNRVTLAASWLEKFGLISEIIYSVLCIVRPFALRAGGHRKFK